MNRPVLRGTEEPITVDVGGSLGNGSVPAGSKKNGSSNDGFDESPIWQCDTCW